MVKNISLIVLLSSIIIGQVHGAGLPRLSRLREKIDNALDNKSSHSFRDLFNQAQQSSNDGHLVIAAPLEKAADQKKEVCYEKMSSFELMVRCKDLQKDFKELYWSNKTELLGNLQALLTVEKRSEGQAHDHLEAQTLLKESILARYGDEKVPLFGFVNDLQAESKKVEDYSMLVFKIMSKKSSQKELLQELFDQTQDLKSNLDKLIKTVEQVLLP